jgi:hypothetical protein
MVDKVVMMGESNADLELSLYPPLTQAPFSRPKLSMGEWLKKYFPPPDEATMHKPSPNKRQDSLGTIKRRANDDGSRPPKRQSLPQPPSAGTSLPNRPTSRRTSRSRSDSPLTPSPSEVLTPESFSSSISSSNPNPDSEDVMDIDVEEADGPQTYEMRLQNAMIECDIIEITAELLFK